jgi:hypothetical protein
MAVSRCQCPNVVACPNIIIHMKHCYEEWVMQSCCSETNSIKLARQSEVDLLSDWLFKVKRALTGLMDKIHTPAAILEWSGAAPVATSSLAHPRVAVGCHCGNPVCCKVSIHLCMLVPTNVCECV